MVKARWFGIQWGSWRSTLTYTGTQLVRPPIVNTTFSEIKMRLSITTVYAQQKNELIKRIINNTISHLRIS